MRFRAHRPERREEQALEAMGAEALPGGLRQMREIRQSLPPAEIRARPVDLPPPPSGLLARMANWRDRLWRAVAD